MSMPPKDAFDSGDPLKIAGALDDELKQLPTETYAAVVNILSQLCEHRIAMIQREAQKRMQEERREQRFAPHLKQ